MIYLLRSAAYSLNRLFDRTKEQLLFHMTYFYYSLPKTLNHVCAAIKVKIESVFDIQDTFYPIVDCFTPQKKYTTFDFGIQLYNLKTVFSKIKKYTLNFPRTNYTNQFLNNINIYLSTFIR